MGNPDIPNEGVTRKPLPTGILALFPILRKILIFGTISYDRSVKKEERLESCLI